MWCHVLRRHMEKHTNIYPAVWCHVLQRHMERHTNISPAVWCTMLCLQRHRKITYIISGCVMHDIMFCKDIETYKYLSGCVMHHVMFCKDTETYKYHLMLCDVWCHVLEMQRSRNLFSPVALCALASFADSETELSPVIRLCDRGALAVTFCETQGQNLLSQMDVVTFWQFGKTRSQCFAEVTA